MPWFYVDDAFSDSKPVMDMPERYRLAVCGLWVLAGAWSAKEMTDGYVPAAKLKTLGAKPRHIEILTQGGPLGAALCEPKSDGFALKNWTKWQQNRDEILAKREKAAEKKRAQRSKGRLHLSCEDENMSPGDTIGTEVVIHRPVPGGLPGPPTPPQPLSRYVGRGTAVGGGTGLPHPRSRFCEDHPDGTTARCGRCADARRAFDGAEAAEQAGSIAAAAASAAHRRAIRAAIDACKTCDDQGRLDDLRPCPGHLRLGDAP